MSDEDALRIKPFIFESVDEDGYYTKTKGREIDQIGFYLRFAHTHFVPCKQCQKKLIKQLKNAVWDLDAKRDDIGLLRATENTFQFRIPFIDGYFVPCENCQKELEKTIFEADLTISNNDYIPPIELYRKCDEIDDDAWETLEKHKATKEEQERFKDGIGETTYL